MINLNIKATLFHLLKKKEIAEKGISFRDLREIRDKVDDISEEEKLGNIHLETYRYDLASAIELYPRHFVWEEGGCRIFRASDSEKLYDSTHPDYSPENDLNYYPKDSKVSEIEFEKISKMVLNVIKEYCPRT